MILYKGQYISNESLQVNTSVMNLYSQYISVVTVISPAVLEFLKAHIDSPEALSTLVSGKAHVVEHSALVMLVQTQGRLK